MNKRDLMIKAHKIAKATVAVVGDYMIAMKLALKKVWSEMSDKILREVGHASGKIVVRMDAEGRVFVNDKQTRICRDASGLIFVWTNGVNGLKNCKIKLEQKHIDMVESAQGKRKLAAAKRAQKAREWNNANNEGCEGFNPYA